MESALQGFDGSFARNGLQELDRVTAERAATDTLGGIEHHVGLVAIPQVRQFRLI
jgi:hypothetical protein